MQLYFEYSITFWSATHGQFLQKSKWNQGQTVIQNVLEYEL